MRRFVCIALGLLVASMIGHADDKPGEKKAEKPIPGVPFKELSAKLTTPLGELVGVEFPKEVTRETLDAPELRFDSNYNLVTKPVLRKTTITASETQKPVWLVFRAGESTGKEVVVRIYSGKVTTSEHTVKVGDREVECLGSDQKETDVAVGGGSFAFYHKGERGYRRLLFVLPVTAEEITIGYQPDGGKLTTVKAKLPASK